MTRIEQIEKLGRTDSSEFAQSLVSQFYQNDSLSEKQWFWVEKLTSKVDSPRVDLTGVVTLLADAARNLKFPRITIGTAAGDTVVLRRAGSQSSRTGAVNVTDDGAWEDRVWYGRIELDGAFTSGRGLTQDVTDLLVSIADDPATAASRHGHLTGNCAFCRRPLSDSRSTEVGYGKTCAGNYGLPWGTTATVEEETVEEVEEIPFDDFVAGVPDEEEYPF